MRNALVLGWFGLAIVIVAGFVLNAANLLAREPDMAGLLAGWVPQMLTGALMAGSMGLVYALIFTLRPSGPAAVMGWLHWACVLGASLAAMASQRLHAQLISGGVDQPNIVALGLAGGAAGVLTLLGLIVFGVVLLVEVSHHRAQRGGR